MKNQNGDKDMNGVDSLSGFEVAAEKSFGECLREARATSSRFENEFVERVKQWRDKPWKYTEFELRKTFRDVLEMAKQFGVDPNVAGRA